jgi:1-acyl-sn-glycerol-3-phosphate acyltransferase
MPVHFLTLRQLPDTWVQAAIRFWGRTALGIAGIQVVRVNPSTLEDLRSRVAVCNHQSTLDVLWGATICPPSPLAIGKKEIVFIPVLNLIWWTMRFIRVDRSDTSRAIASLRGVADEILAGHRTLVVAPEGTRSRTAEMLPFKKGAFHLAIEAQVPLYPIVMAGAHELMPRGKPVARPGKILLSFLPPIETRGLTRDDVDSLIERARGQMLQEYARIRALLPKEQSLPTRS